MSTKVEIIIPFRNQGIWLKQACKSLQNQSETNWQALLIDDKSDQENVELAEQIIRQDARFRLLHISTKKIAPGPWMARNLGLEIATAPLVAFLDADDLWHPQKLERQLPFHQKTTRDVISVCAYHRFEDSSKKIIQTRTPPNTLTLKQLWKGNQFLSPR